MVSFRPHHEEVSLQPYPPYAARTPKSEAKKCVELVQAKLKPPRLSFYADSVNRLGVVHLVTAVRTERINERPSHLRELRHLWKNELIPFAGRPFPRLFP